MTQKSVLLFFIFYLCSLLQANVVHKITINGVINPVSAEYIIKSIERAEKEQAELLIIELDTPGGLMNSMHDIEKKILAADVPVAIFIFPSGSRAGSAGVFITMAAHIAAMAPGTNIGSAHPVTMMNPQDSSQAMMEKITNDAVAHIKSVTLKRGRNAEWAEKAVRESENITETEALKMNVVDYVVPTVDSLLTTIHGKEIEVLSGKKILQTRLAHVETFAMNWRQRILIILSDPNILYILLMLAITGLSLELYNPGSILPGVVGGICLILFLFSVQIVPINYAGILLIIFAAILFLLEIKVTSYGILSIGGIISLILGSVMLLDRTIPFLKISMTIIIGVTITITLLFLSAISLAIRTHRKKPITGKEGLIGEEGVVIENLSPEGSIEVHGEIWKAHALNTIKKGTPVIVEEVDSKYLKLKVRVK
jgi:membrane-bound serine protease (ClpP class)